MNWRGDFLTFLNPQSITLKFLAAITVVIEAHRIILLLLDVCVFSIMMDCPAQAMKSGGLSLHLTIFSVKT